ncbi:MAG: biotin transporter BioY [Solobacterium sp.]|nr:biotin transporter BioY [Solobacterium sp.]
MKLSVKQIAAIGIMAAVISVLSPLAIPLSTEVPISLATLAVMLAGALIGSKLGTFAVLIYILLGMIGIPVFANYSAGAGVVFGMTGGYIIGYLPLAFLTGWIYERFGRKKSGVMEYVVLFVGMLVGTVVLYVIGTIWFMRYTGMSLAASLAACVIPFIPGDLLKMVVVCLLVPRLKKTADRLIANS